LEINEILIELNRIHETLSISIDLHKELVGEIKTLEIQVQSPQPKNIIITESLKTIRTILESVTGNALTPIIVEQISKLLN
jgi:hypothetical protein